MTVLLTRRSAAVGLACLLGGGTSAAAAVAGTDVGAIEARHGGRLGVFALDTGSGRTLAHRADERFLMCSTFKGPLGAMVLSRLDAGTDSIHDVLPYGAKDLVIASPVTRVYAKYGGLTIGTLCAAMLQESDNTAANLLLAHVGGPAALTAYVRSKGDTVTRFDRYEPDVGKPSGTRDTTTPHAITTLARTLVLGNALSPDARDLLERWMAANVVGRRRLRASFPAGWDAADRTGSDDGQCDDYAVARPPGRAPLVMAAYYDAPGMAVEVQEAVLREVGTAIVRWAS